MVAQAPFLSGPCGPEVTSGISCSFPQLFRSMGQVDHVLLTRSPLSSREIIRRLSPRILARLACLIHAASVRPEPGSNSPLENWLTRLFPKEQASVYLFQGWRHFDAVHS